MYDRRVAAVGLLVAMASVPTFVGATAADAQSIIREVLGIDVDRLLAKKAEPADEDQEEDENPQINALIQQYRPAYKGKLDASLHTLRELCHPSREQQERLLEAGDAALDAALRVHAKRMLKLNQQNGNFVVNVGRSRGSNPWTAVQIALNAAVRDHLSPEQSKVYLEDLREREKFRRRATARTLVSALDTQLNLNQEQREAIFAALLENWQDEWENSVRGLMYGATYLPNLPSKALTPHLNEKQMQLWSQSPHGNTIHFGDNEGFLGHGKLNIPPFVVQDDTESGDEAAEPVAEQPGEES